VILTAGGLGKRFGKPYPKQLETIKGLSLLKRTASFFETMPPDRMLVTAPEGFERAFRKELKGLSFPVSVITGGNERSDSVRAAVTAFVEEGLPADSIVLVHDGVRPFLKREVVEAVVTGVREMGAAIPYIPVTGTVRRLKDDVFTDIVERKDLAIVTTPQGATLGILSHCFARQQLCYPDESTLLTAEGVEIRPVEDWPLNIKITTQADLAVDERLLEDA